jgi:hypothetical protein
MARLEAEREKKEKASGRMDRVGPFRLNIQCRSGQVRLIGIEYSIVTLIRWAHSDSIFNAGPDRLG